MRILLVNKVMELCQITTGGRRYSCPTKEINGQLFFRFKRIWHPVAEFLGKGTEELVRESGQLISKSNKQQ